MGASSRASSAPWITAARTGSPADPSASRSNSSRTRWRSSPAAFSVNVMAATVRTSPVPWTGSSTQLTYRSTSTRVFPVPAPASSR